MDRKGQMIKKIFIPILLAIILCAAPSWATTFHVTQAGGVGSNPLSAAQFNGLSGNYSNDIFYFSGSFSTKIEPKIYGTGTGASVVTLDGYEGGDCDPINDNCASGALIPGLRIQDGHDYITVQDFRATGFPTWDDGGTALFYIGSVTQSQTSDYIIIRRNY